MFSYTAMAGALMSFTLLWMSLAQAAMIAMIAWLIFRGRRGRLYRLLFGHGGHGDDGDEDSEGSKENEVADVAEVAQAKTKTKRKTKEVATESILPPPPSNTKWHYTRKGSSYHYSSDCIHIRDKEIYTSRDTQGRDACKICVTKRFRII